MSFAEFLKQYQELFEWLNQVQRKTQRTVTSLSEKYLNQVGLLCSINIYSVFCCCYLHYFFHRLVGLVVKASTSGAEDPGFESHLRKDFSRSSNISDLKIGAPVATLPGSWHYRVSAGTGRPDVSILWLGEVESLICNFYLSVAARKIVCADPSLRYTSLFLGRWATNKHIIITFFPFNVAVIVFFRPLKFAQKTICSFILSFNNLIMNVLT